MKSMFVVLIGLGTLSLAACDSPGLSSKSKTPNQAAKPPVGDAMTTSARFGQGADGSSAGAQRPAVFTPNLTVSSAIAQACGIAPRGDSKLAPSFEFDSAALGEVDRLVLTEIAKCLTQGALRGRQVSLVGRADARGEEEYNMTLGESRADSVRRYFVGLGVGRDRMQATSRGELDATGRDEGGWAHDRRVDIELVP